MELIHTAKAALSADGFAAHLIGYVGEVSENELEHRRVRAV